MGLLDLPGPLLDWLDAALSHVITAPGLRLALWGAAGAVVSMALYWALSPQARIARIKSEALAARQRLEAYDGAFADAWPLIGRMLRLSLRQLAVVTWPAVLASLPVLCLIVWLSTAYGHSFPAADQPVEARAFPPPHQARLINGHDPRPGQEGAPAHLEIADAAGRTIGDLDLAAPVSTVHKREWWNGLIGNPAGYLPEEWAVERVEIDLPRTEYLSFGPWWLRSWEAVFFATLLACSVAIKLAFRIQ
jgi:hypothetical protein